MRLLINLIDIRKFSQFSKSANDENRNALINGVQENQLANLFKPALYYDFFNYINNDWLSDTTVYERVNDTQIKAVGVDLSAWVGYALRLDNNTFVTIKTAVFSTDTLLTVIGNNLTNEENKTKYVPDTITSVEYKINSDYLKLLNGTTYKYYSNTIEFKGIRPFLTWNFLNNYTMLGDNKQADAGNISLIGTNFTKTSHNEKKLVSLQYLENSNYSENSIIQYLNTENSTFTKWVIESKNPITSFDIGFI